MGGVKDQIMYLFKTNSTKQYSKPKHAKNVYGIGKKLRKLKIKKQSEDNIIKNIRNLFWLKKGNEAIKDKIVRDIKTLFEQEEDYYKLVRVAIFWNNNYIEYEGNGNRNKYLSINECLDKIKHT